MAAAVAATATPRRARRITWRRRASPRRRCARARRSGLGGDGLLSEDAAATSASGSPRSALRERGEALADPGALEAVVREMLKPMLKDWLDRHLLEIVEDLVTREIAGSSAATLSGHRP